MKTIVEPLLDPVLLSLCILAVGLALLWGSRKKTAGNVLVTLGTLYVLIFSLRPVSDSLLAPLEKQYKPLDEAAYSQFIKDHPGVNRHAS